MFFDSIYWELWVTLPLEGTFRGTAGPNKHLEEEGGGGDWKTSSSETGFRNTFGGASMSIILNTMEAFWSQ